MLFRWLRIAVASQYEPAFPALERFLTSQGRMKVRRAAVPGAGAESPQGRPMAERIYGGAGGLPRAARQRG